MPGNDAISVNVEEPRDMIAKTALVVYEEQLPPYEGRPGQQILRFEITPRGEFRNPRALDADSLLDIFCRREYHGAVEYLDNRILGYSNSTIVWYEPARQAKIFFDAPEKDRQDLNTLCRKQKVYWPNLIFKLRGTSLSCRALKSSRRPKRTTKLYVAPLTHIDAASGHVCLPAGLSLDNNLTVMEKMRRISENFYSGVFGHATQGMLTTHPGGHDSLWREILSSPEDRRFPCQYLKSANQTLNDFLQSSSY